MNGVPGVQHLLNDAIIARVISTYGTETNYLRVYMAHIRRKLEPDPANPKYFITEPGMGYRFDDREALQES